MNFLELAKKRYSVRSFNTKPVEQEKVDLILEAARVSPTACNLQPQRILVLNKKETLNKLKECTPFHFDAPLAFLICYDEKAAWVSKYDGKSVGEVDASIITTQMMLETAELGLGSTWVGSFDPEKVKEIFKLPKDYIPIAILPTGYPAKDAKPASGHDSRLSIEKTVFYNSFN